MQCVFVQGGVKESRVRAGGCGGRGVGGGGGGKSVREHTKLQDQKRHKKTQVITTHHARREHVPREEEKCGTLWKQRRCRCSRGGK